MQTITSEISLRAAVNQLEIKRTAEAEILRAEFLILSDRLKPVNLLTSTIRDLTRSKTMKKKMINVSLGLAASYLLKFVVGRVVKGPVKSMLLPVIMLGVADLAVRHPEFIRSLGKGIFNLFKGRSLHIVEP